jgi:6-phosphogluconolactonase
MPNFIKQILPGAKEVGIAAADSIVATALSAVKNQGRFSIALSGGSTPKAAYALMAADPLVSRMPWNQTRLFFGDERLYPHDHPDSNCKMATDAMISKVPIPSENVFPIMTDHPEPEKCAEWYEDILKTQFKRRTDDFPVFDLVLLGIGPDGHTASLFPGTPAPKVLDKWMTWCDPNSFNPAIKPPVKRVTITPPVIWNAAHVFVLANGAEKKPMLEKIFAEQEPENAPVSRLLRKCKGEVTFFMDNAAVTG